MLGAGLIGGLPRGPRCFIGVKQAPPLVLGNRRGMGENSLREREKAGMGMDILGEQNQGKTDSRRLSFPLRMHDPVGQTFQLRVRNPDSFIHTEIKENDPSGTDAILFTSVPPINSMKSQKRKKKKKKIQDLFQQGGILHICAPPLSETAMVRGT